MERESRRESGLQELQPSAPGRRPPGWLAPAATFVLALLASIVAAGSLQPFHAGNGDAEAYDRGYAAGLEAGAEEARQTLIEAEAEAYAQGRREAGPQVVEPAQGSIVELVRQVGSGELELFADDAFDGVYARGYLAGYASGLDERGGS